MPRDSERIVLAIEQRSKHVPYPPEDRGSGERNIGFQDLKGNEQAARAIPEVQDSEALRDAVVAISRTEIPFFTVGCEKSLNRHNGGFWKRGYLEFSWNCAEFATDAMSYFPLFFHFSRDAEEFTQRTRTRFFWKLQQADFRKIDKAGFTCCVWITTADHKTADDCERVWSEGVRLLTQHLLRIRPKADFTPIYGPGSK